MSSEHEDFYTAVRFSTVYSAIHQLKFNKALQEEDLKTAAEVLRNLPQPLTCSDKLKRYVVLAQGYQRLVECYQYQESEGELKELNAYRNLGDLDEVSRRLSQLGELEDLEETVEELNERLNQLKGLEDLEQIFEEL